MCNIDGINIVKQQKEFNSRETQQSEILNDKHNEITNLTARIINLEAKGKVIEKEN